MAKPRYFDKPTLEALKDASKDLAEIRNRLMQQTSVDLLDTDAISALFIYEIVSQYDQDFNINFARNGEDAKSNGVLIENKATRVQGPLTRTGKPRKGAGQDAAFTFHAMGDLDHQRYIFVARNKDDLSVVRLYDISAADNRQLVLDHLMAERNAWLERGKKDPKQMKRDTILLHEKYILANIKFKESLNINGCVVRKD